MATPLTFVQTCWPLAVRAGARYRVAPLVLLAQAAVESAWGGSYSFIQRNNPAGITASGKPNRYWLGEKSVSSVSGLYFRVYPTLQAGFYDFARLLREKYPTAAVLSTDVPRYARAISYSPYISEANGDHRPTYEQNINRAAALVQTALGSWQPPASSTLLGLLAGGAFITAGLYWQREEIKPAYQALRRQLSSIL